MILSRLWQYFSALAAAAAVQWSCPASSVGPCFSTPKTWREAQRTCEAHGSNVVSVLSASANTDLGNGGCFSPAPWNNWTCTWIGLTDIRNDGQWEWADGETYSYNNWGKYEPSTVETDNQDCTAICQGGALEGYSGNFWVDLECDSNYTFCCDQATFVADTSQVSGSTDSFLEKLGNFNKFTTTTTSTQNLDVYAERQLCFSSRLTWDDAHTLCQEMGTNLITIHSTSELERLSRTVHFSRVSASWGLDWKCFWTGYHDRAEEGSYQWVSKKRPNFSKFGPFEAENGDGTEEDCVAVCQSDCGSKNATACVDLSEYGYVSSFFIDAKCTEEWAFCCDGAASEFVAKAASATTASPSAAARLTTTVGRTTAAQSEGSPSIATADADDEDDDSSGKDTIIAALACVAALSTIAALVSFGFLMKIKQAPAGPLSNMQPQTVGNQQQ